MAGRQARMAANVSLLMCFLPVQIVVLDAGRVVEQGNHKQLVQRGGRYAALVSAQDLTLQQTLM